MIQVTYDEYKQYYMKRDTWSLFLEEKKGEVEEQRCRRAPLPYLFSSKS